MGSARSTWRVSRLTRRRLLTGLAAVAASACGDPITPTPLQTPPASTLPAATVPVPAGAGASLALMGWPFRPDLLRQRLDTFERTRPGLHVVHEQALRDYATRALAGLARTPSVDVVQVRAGLGGPWAAAGALSPLPADADQQAAVDAMWPHARASTRHDDADFGLPYYSDVMLLVYNRQLLDRLGAGPPATLDELREISRRSVERRIVEFPITLNLAPKAFANLPWWALIYGSGATLQRPSGADPLAVDVLTWLRAAIADDRIVDPNFRQTTYDELALQQHLFSIVGGFTLKRLHDSAPGQFGIAPVPGLQGPAGTVAWTPFYARSARSSRPADAAALIRFLGGRDATGEFASAAFWLRHEGLLPAYPTVLRDAEARAALSAWADPDLLTTIIETARPLAGQWAPWFLRWEHAMYDDVMAALFGRTTPAGALAAVHQRAVDLNAPQP